MLALALTGCTNNFFSPFDEATAGPTADSLRTEYQELDPNDPAEAPRIMALSAEAGSSTIVANDEALETVNNFGNVITMLSNSDSTPNETEIMDALFPDNMSASDAERMIDAFIAASGDFAAFANASANTTDDPLNSGQKGDTVQMAIISLSIAAILDDGSGGVDATRKKALVELATGDKTAEQIATDGTFTTNPFENLGSGSTSLAQMITYAGLEDTF